MNQSPKSLLRPPLDSVRERCDPLHLRDHSVQYGSGSDRLQLSPPLGTVRERERPHATIAATRYSTRAVATAFNKQMDQVQKLATIGVSPKSEARVCRHLNAVATAPVLHRHASPHLLVSVSRRPYLSSSHKSSSCEDQKAGAR